MIKTVVVSLNWKPEDIDKLYVDNIDYHGLEFWYDHISKEIDRLNPTE